MGTSGMRTNVGSGFSGVSGVPYPCTSYTMLKLRNIDDLQIDQMSLKDFRPVSSRTKRSPPP